MTQGRKKRTTDGWMEGKEEGGIKQVPTPPTGGQVVDGDARYTITKATDPPPPSKPTTVETAGVLCGSPREAKSTGPHRKPSVWRWRAGTGRKEVKTRARRMGRGADTATAEDDAPQKPASPPDQKARTQQQGAARQKLKSQNPHCPHETPARRRGKTKRGAGDCIEKNGTSQGRSGEEVGDHGDWMKGAGRGGREPGKREGMGKERMEDGKEELGCERTENGEEIGDGGTTRATRTP
ncbi:hypothetical protein C8J57DRAFT_1565573 [Mycena rebaudengoi]|nr:hypothetical protein C8J57DRAFT_1565573 [Mycena rebaudengoi]